MYFFNSFSLAEICFYGSCTFLNYCDKIAKIAPVFADFTILNLVYFLVVFF